MTTTWWSSVPSRLSATLVPSGESATIEAMSLIDGESISASSISMGRRISTGARRGQKPD